MQPIVALWKDPIRGTREIPLEPGAQGVLLTASTDLTTHRRGDGRRQIDNCTEFFDVGVYQVRAAAMGSDSSAPPAAAAAPPLEIEEITELTSWAEAVAEALAHAPARQHAVLASARSGEPWREALDCVQPSAQLASGLDFMCAAIEQRIGSGNATLAGVLESVRFSGSDLLPLDQLARSILGAALEQRLTRQAWERRREAR